MANIICFFSVFFLFFFNIFVFFFQYICFFFNIFVFFLFFLVIHCPPGPFVARRGLFSTFLRLFHDFLSFFWLFCDFLTFFVFFSYHFHYFLTFFFQLSYLKMATNHNKDLPTLRTYKSIIHESLCPCRFGHANSHAPILQTQMLHMRVDTRDFIYRYICVRV